MNWSAEQRFRAVMAGEIPDRSPVSAWLHCREEEHPGGALDEWTSNLQQTYGWDLIKINPRATYYGEIWGNQYRVGDYEERDIPRQLSVAINSEGDLAEIRRHDLTHPVISEQLELLSQVRRRSPAIPIQQTLFSPFSTLVQLSGISYYSQRPVFGAGGALGLADLLGADRKLLHGALEAIAETFAEYAAALMKRGAAGIFYAFTGTANKNIMSESDFDELSLPYDQIVLDAVRGGENILHACGAEAELSWISNLPGAISWDQFAAGNPSLDEYDATTVVGGVNHTAFAEHDPTAIYEQAAASAALGRVRPVVVTPTCSIVSAHASEPQLRALVAGVKESAADAGAKQFG